MLLLLSLIKGFWTISVSASSGGDFCTYKLITMPLWVIWYAHKYFHCVRMCVCHVKNFWKNREYSFHSVFNHRRTLTTLLCYFFHIFCASIAHQMYIILVFCHCFYKVSGHLFVMWILMEISFEYLIVLN